MAGGIISQSYFPSLPDACQSVHGEPLTGEVCERAMSGGDRVPPARVYVRV